ncbi:beta-L-arabinofuranosidase domain-containing protein [Saccharicrinis sp. FJH54]|uniref:beta-L-arabinofuranosidase domain-containing protein n=1 Tax=Saccharicrinis sp. FJH54 TaxID=3344665 RepID=UPI0035D4EF5E
MKKRLLFFTVLGIMISAISSASTDTIFYQFSNSGISFEGLYANPTNGCAVTGDFNSDNRPDILVMGPNYNDFNTSFITILRNTGNGFERNVLSASGLNNGSMAYFKTGDKKFLMAFQGGSGYPATTTNAKAFIAEVSFVTASRTKFVKLQDLDYGLYDGDIMFLDINNDGHNDLVQFGGPKKVYTYLNDGNNAFALTTEVSGLKGTVKGKTKTVDLNNDGLLDIVSIDEQNGLYVYINNGDLSFNASKVESVYSFKSKPRFEFGDFNNDQHIDLVAFDYSSFTGSYAVALFFSDGAGHFTEQEANGFMGVEQAAVAVADMNQDGNQDIIYAGENNKDKLSEPNGSITKKAYVLLGDGEGGFMQYIKSTPEGYSPDMSSLAPLSGGQYIVDDFNGDNKPDIFALGNIGNDFPGKVPRKADLYISQKVDFGSPVDPAIETLWNSYDYQEVRLTNSRIKQAQDKEIRYLKTLVVNRLFANTLKYNKGINTYSNYGGWEDGGYGCSFAHYLSAVSMGYAATGDNELLNRANQCVDIISDAQDVMGDGFFSFADGTTWAFDKTAKEKKVSLGGWDENGHPWDINGVGIFLYAHHKIFAALRDAYLYTYNEKARIAFLKFSDWLLMWMQNFDEANMQKILEAEHGGYVETLTDAYALSGHTKYLDGALRFTRQNFATSMSNNVDDLSGRHSNFHVPMALGSTVNYLYSGNETSRKTGHNFFNMVLDHHTLCDGGNGNNERFGIPDQLTYRLGTRSSETCSSYNMLKLAKRLFTLEGKDEYLDYYEKTLYNHILACLSPVEGEGITYYTGMLPGQFKMYDNLYNNFWCCVGTGMESHVKYVDAIYFKNDDGILLNLFIPSTLSDSESGLKLEMKTDFPASDEINITINDAGSFNKSFFIRYPSWAEKESMKIFINGNQETILAEPGEKITISGNWSSGDEIRIVLPCNFHMEDLPDDYNVSALFYGPVLLAGDMGAVGQTDVGSSAPQQDITNPNLPDYFPELNGRRDSIGSWLRKTEGKFEFETYGLEKNYVLKPFYDTHHRRYTLYWKIADSSDAEMEKLIIPDRVLTGNAVSEANHNVRHSASGAGYGVFPFWGNSYHRFRDAQADGFIAYKLDLLDPELHPDTQYYLQLTYFGQEPSGYGNFSMYADNVEFAQQGSITRLAPLDFAVRYYPIPKNLTNGKKAVEITFKGGLLSLYGVKITTTDDIVKTKTGDDPHTDLNETFESSANHIITWYAKQQLTIKNAEGYKFQVIDVNGRQILSEVVKSSFHTIDLNLRSGVYLVRCTNEDNIYVSKFMVNLN